MSPATRGALDRLANNKRRRRALPQPEPALQRTLRSPLDLITDEYRALVAGDEGYEDILDDRYMDDLGVVTGEPGVGKTSAMRHLCRALPQHEQHIVYLADATVKPLDLYRMLAAELGLRPSPRAQIIGDIKRALVTLVDQRGVVPIIILDDAQALRDEVLHELHSLTTLHFDDREYLTIWLVGHPRLDPRLHQLSASTDRPSSAPCSIMPSPSSAAHPSVPAGHGWPGRPVSRPNRPPARGLVPAGGSERRWASGCAPTRSPGRLEFSSRFRRDLGSFRDNPANSRPQPPPAPRVHHITNITKDGAIPPLPETNWLNARFNNFRQNVQPGGLFNAPDATVVGLLCDTSLIDAMQVKVSVVVKNNGALELPALTPVRIEIEKDGVVAPVLDTATNMELLPGQFEVLDLQFALPMPAPAPPFLVRAIIDPDGAVDECVEDNNAGATDCVVAG